MKQFRIVKQDFAKKKGKTYKELFQISHTTSKTPPLSLFAKLTKMLSKKQIHRLLALGIDGAGKTTMLYKMNPLRISTPYVRYPIENYIYPDFNIHSFDLFDSTRIIRVLELLLIGIHGIIYIIDSCDLERLEESILEFKKVMQMTESENIPCLIFANKVFQNEKKSLFNKFKQII